MQNFMITLLICSVTMSLLALLYMASTPFLAKRYSEKGRYYAWLFIVIGLIIPFRPQWGNTLVTVDMPNYAIAPVPQMVNDTIAFMPTIAPTESIAPLPTTFNISWWQGIAMIWLIGMIGFIVYQAIRHYRFTKTAKRWSEAITDEQMLSLFHELKSEMGIKKRIELYLCPCVGSPMMIGIVKPKILLPTVELAQDELYFILKHELVHYKRKDILYKFLVLIATAIHWFNPVVYLMAKAIDVLCETSCDTEVVKNTSENTRQRYSEAIIGVVKYRSKMKLHTALSTNFYGGKKGMKNRISSIMDTSKKRMGAVILCCVLVLTIGTGFMIATNTVSANAQEPVTSNIATFETNTNATTSQDRRSSTVTLAEYAEWGLTIEGLYPNADGSFRATAVQNVFYQGQLIRGFSDFGHGVDMSISSFDQGEDMWIHVIRDTDGNIEGFAME